MRAYLAQRFPALADRPLDGALHALPDGSFVQLAMLPRLRVRRLEVLRIEGTSVDRPFEGQPAQRLGPPTLNLQRSRADLVTYYVGITVGLR